MQTLEHLNLMLFFPGAMQMRQMSQRWAPGQRRRLLPVDTQATGLHAPRVCLRGAPREQQGRSLHLSGLQYAFRGPAFVAVPTA